MKRFKIFLVMSVIFAQVLLVQTVSAQSVSLSTNAVLEGGTVTVYWSGFNGNVNLRFYKGNTFITYANANVPGTGQQPLVMTGYEVRDNYWVRVELRSDTSIYRDSNHFSVSNPSVSLSANFVEQGDTVIVYWSGFASNVNLKFYRGNTFLAYANTNVSGSGQQPLVMTNYEPGNYRVKVELRSKTSVYKYSDYFSVSANDELPYFQNAELASDVTRPETINFSGYAKDDIGLKKISMTVSGPTGTRTVFTRNISGISESLSRYYFNSGDTSYANAEGSYTLTLNIEDTSGQTASQIFYVNVYEIPATPETTARILIDHTYRGDLTVDIGTGSPDNPVWITRAWNRSGGSVNDLDIEADISGGASYLPPNSGNRWFLKVYDAANGDQGAIREFTISYQGQNYTSVDPSVPITDFNTSYAYIGNAPPYFQNAELASDVTRPETINFSGYAKDDTGLKKISMTVSGPAGTRTVFTHDISGTSKSLSKYYFNSGDTSYANEEGAYTLTLNIEDISGQTVSRTFYVTVSDPPVTPEATARIVIDHTYRGDLAVDVGAGSPDNPVWVTRVWNRSGGTADDLDIETDISGGASYLPPDSGNRWFLKVYDGANGDQGTIRNFTISYQGDTYTSGSLPVTITDYNTSYAYVEDNDSESLIIPDDFVSVRSARGVTLYKNGDHYVQAVRLNHGASLKLLYSMRNEVPIEDVCISPVFSTQSLNVFWDEFSNSFSNAFSVTNGTFFGASPTQLAFSLKADNEIKTCGYEGDYPNDMLLLELWDNRTVTIEEASVYRQRILDPGAGSNIIGGLTPHADIPDRYVYRQRTFIGVVDNDIILILNSKYATQYGAAQILQLFGVNENNIIMLDGGGSTQMICEGESYITSARQVPQVIGVLYGR